jgi:urease gamma subunit
MFFNLKTSELVVIPAHERSLEKRIIRLVAKKIKNGSTLEELMDMISQKFSLSRDDTEEGLAELIRKLYEAGMLRTED